MKLKRLAALGLSLALTLSVAVVPAHALQFTDVTEAFWGYSYITRMSTEGLAKGYEDGTFKPNGKMTAAETLLFCARATGVEKSVQAKIAEDRKEEISAILPSGMEHGNMSTWATAEMALAVESGVLSLAELEALSSIDPRSQKEDAQGKVSAGKTYLEETMSRENITMYLVRAMQLEPLAKSLSNYSLSYPDKDKITAALRPYVYVLTQYGIVNGKGNDEGSAPVFDPQGSVTRAEMTTMLCRALDFMKEVGIVTELSEYTDYSWVAGTISAVTEVAGGNTAVTLVNPLTDAPQSYTLPANVKIYDDNMLTTTSALKRGQLARLNLTKKGAISEVRISGVLNTYAGSVSDLEDNQLTLLVNGQTQHFSLDRFTSVAIGSNVGDRNLIDYDAGYTTATAYVDEMGHLAAVRLNGGTQLVEGLIASVTAPAAGSADRNTTLEVAAHNGTLAKYSIPEGIMITVNGAPGTLNNLAHTGKAVRLRVNADNNSVVTVAVDTMSKYIQGPIKRVGRTGTAPTLIITDRFTGKDSPAYPIMSDAIVTYDGESKTVSQIEAGWYATAVISSEVYTNDVVIQLDAYPGSVQVQGVLSEIKYGAPTIIRVTLPDDSISEYSFEVDAIPPITRGGKAAKITDLITGDTVVLTVRYNQLEKIDATPQTASLTGTITEVSLRASGTTMTVAFADGSTHTYTVPTGVSVTQNGVLTNASALQPGATVALILNGEDVVSIDITAQSSTSSRLSGTVYTITNTSSTKTIDLLISGNSTPVKVNVMKATLQSAKGESVSLNSLTTGDLLEVYGEFDGPTFVAGLVVKL